jgi:hypothetical protein
LKIGHDDSSAAWALKISEEGPSRIEREYQTRGMVVCNLSLTHASRPLQGVIRRGAPIYNRDAAALFISICIKTEKHVAGGILLTNNLINLAGGAIAVFFACAVGAQQVPAALQVPANEQLVEQVHAKGDQIYSCKVDGAQSRWTLKAPDAQLFDKDGKAFGKHFAGPSWEATDGSRVVGKASANMPSPDAESIPWLLVKVASHEGDGVLTRVTSIQRINTKGGKAPASGCDASHEGQEVRVPYSADYLFFAPR